MRIKTYIEYLKKCNRLLNELAREKDGSRALETGASYNRH